MQRCEHRQFFHLIEANCESSPRAPPLCFHRQACKELAKEPTLTQAAFVIQLRIKAGQDSVPLLQVSVFRGTDSFLFRIRVALFMCLSTRLIFSVSYDAEYHSTSSCASNYQCHKNENLKTKGDQCIAARLLLGKISTPYETRVCATQQGGPHTDRACEMIQLSSVHEEEQ